MWLLVILLVVESFLSVVVLAQRVKILAEVLRTLRTDNEEFQNNLFRQINKKSSFRSRFDKLKYPIKI